MGKIKVATTACEMVYDKEKNLQKILDYTREAARSGAKIVAFPEIALQAYPIDTSRVVFEDFEYQFAESEFVPEGPSVQKIIRCAQENDIYVAFGMTERDSDYQYKLFNTCVLVGPEGYIGKYHKVHRGTNENFIWSRGDGFPVFDTKIGKIGLCICYDQWFPEAFRELVLQGAQLIVFVTAWHRMHPEEPVEKDPMFRIYSRLQSIRPMENTVYMIGSNLAGESGKCLGKDGNHVWMGYSNIVDPYGDVIATTGLDEGIVYADIDLIEDIYKAQREGFVGDQVLKDRQPDCYTHIQTTLF